MKNFQRARQGIFPNINNLKICIKPRLFKYVEGPLKGTATYNFLRKSSASQYHFYAFFIYTFLQLPKTMGHKVTIVTFCDKVS